MERKMGIMAECLKGASVEETMPKIAAAGFNCYFTGHYTPNEVERVVAAGDKAGLTCESIHAPFAGINKMWLSGMDYLPIYQGMKTSIDAAAANGVPTVVVHISSGWYAPQMNDLGLARYDSLVEYAMEKGVTLAFENLRMVGNVSYFRDRYAALENVGYCLDMGHEHCYTSTVCFMDIFREKAIATHIHDNFGIKEPFEEDTDLHLLPFEGNMDYEVVMKKLNTYGYKHSLILEVSNSNYLHLSQEEFLKTAYERLLKISQMGK